MLTKYQRKKHRSINFRGIENGIVSVGVAKTKKKTIFKIGLLICDYLKFRYYKKPYCICHSKKWGLAP